MVERAGRYYGAAFRRVSRSDSGRSALPHQIQCGGGCSGAALSDGDGGGRGRLGQAWKIG